MTAGDQIPPFLVCLKDGRRFAAAEVPDAKCPVCGDHLVAESSVRDVLAPTAFDARSRLSPQPSFATAPPEVVEASQDPRKTFGKYVLCRVIGAGGMGSVYKAFDRNLGRFVAVKFLHGESDSEIERFKREARAMAALDHPHIAQIHEIGEHEGRHYISMQYIDGDGLNRLRFELRQAAEVIRDAARTLDFAQQKGFIHRDIKPANLMVDKSSHVWVMDFGLAKSTKPGSSMTASEAVLGTPAYMAPEQASGEKADIRSDVYGLGATLYELVTHEPPFAGPTPIAIMRKVIFDDPAPPRKVSPKIARDIETIVLKAMAKEPARRYPTAGALADDLDRYLRGEAIEARPASLIYKAGLLVRRNKAATVATTVIAFTVLALALRWWLTPATLNIRVTPPGARVRVGDKDIISTGEAEPVPLAPGFYQIAAGLRDHGSASRDVLVGRGEQKTVMIDLKHDEGFLDAEAYPHGGEIEVNGGEIEGDGALYGSLIHRHPLHTAKTHRLRAFMEGHFTQERTIPPLTKDEVYNIRLPLDIGSKWTRPFQGNLKDAFLTGDLDDDGVPDVVATNDDRLVGLSGRDGKELWSAAIPRFSGCVDADLGGSIGHAFVAAASLAAGLKVTCISRAGQEIWTWPAPAKSFADVNQANPIVLNDLTGDGVKEVAAVDRDGCLYVIDGAAGKEKEIRRIETTALVQGGMRLQPDGSILFFGAQRNDGSTDWKPSRVIGCVRPADGTIAWRSQVPIDAVVELVDTGGPGLDDVLVAGKVDWTLYDGRTGESRKEIQSAGRIVSDRTAWTDLDGDGTADLVFVGANGDLHAMRTKDSMELWHLEGPVRRVIATSQVLLAAAEDRLWILNRATGEKLREVSDVTEEVCAFDWDGDGLDEVFAVSPGVGLLCLTATGNIRWELRLANFGEFTFRQVGDIDGDGLSEFLIQAQNTVALVRGPRELWISEEAQSPLGRCRIVEDLNGDGAPELACAGRWTSGKRPGAFVRIYDGESGRVLKERPADGRSLQALAVGNRGGASILAFAMQRDDADGDSKGYIVAFEAEKFLREGEECLWKTCLDDVTRSDAHVDGPLFLKDLNDDGTADVACRLVRGSGILVLDGRDGARLETPVNEVDPVFRPSRQLIEDLDGDGRNEAVLAESEGPRPRLTVSDPAESKPLWHVELDPPAPLDEVCGIADFDGDGVKDIVVTASDRRIHVINGRATRAARRK